MKIQDNKIEHVHFYTRGKDEPARLLTAMFGSQFCAPYDVGPTGNTVIVNPENGLELVLRPGQPGEIFRICFVIDDIEEGRARFTQRGVRILKEVNLPNIAHELQFDPRDTEGIAIQLGVWGPQLDVIVNAGLEGGRRVYPAPASIPIDLVGKSLDRVQCVVEDLERTARFLADLLDIDFSEPFEVPEWKVRAVGSSVGLVLLTPLSEDSVLKDEIAQRGMPHISRIGFSVKDLDRAIGHFASLGVGVDRLLERPGLRIAHFRPDDTHEIGFQLREFTVGAVPGPEAVL